MKSAQERISGNSSNAIDHHSNQRGITSPSVPVLQTKDLLQKQEQNDDKLPVQGMVDVSAKIATDETRAPLQAFKAPPLSKREDIQPIQAFRQQQKADVGTPVQKQENKTGMPENLKSGIENLSGFSMDDVRVHYNSVKPAQLQALAYAQGEEIHIVSGQEKHLPHEAWHVVQQKQGRVQATMQLKGDTPVNDDHGLEQEADVMGQMAMQHTPETEAAISQYAQPKTSPTAQRQPVVQRALGFEFETGWKIWDYTPVKVWELSGKQGKPPAMRPLVKKEGIYEGSGFKVEADEAGEGMAELEFIVHPPIDANEMGRGVLFERMVHMTVIGAKLIRAAQAANWESFRLSAVTGNQSDEKFVIKPINNQLDARPQVTAGISLGKVSELGKDHGGAKLPAMFKATKTGIEGYAGSIDELNSLPPFNETPMSAELKGFFIMVGSYLSNGSHAVFYPKQLGDSVLLARTDFATLYKMIPETERAFFKKNPKLLIRYSMIVADLDGSETGEPVIGKVWNDPDDLGKGRSPVGPSREKWLSFIMMGYDLLSGAHYKELADHYKDTEDKDTGKNLESMGELGSKTEKVGPDDKDGGIFELRSAALANAAGIIPLLDWQPFTDNLMKYFIELEK